MKDLQAVGANQMTVHIEGDAFSQPLKIDMQQSKEKRKKFSNPLKRMECELV